MTNKYSQVALIGNGFDLNQGLKTSYSDFIKSEEFQALALSSNSYLVNHLIDQHNLQNWIDIENELTQYSAKIHPSLIRSLWNEFKVLCDILKEYLKTIEGQGINKHSHSYQLLTEVTKNKEFLIIDFNYTKTTELILQDLGFNASEIKSKILKIHGSLEEDEIIFGVEDDAHIKPEHIFLKKAANKSFKATNIQDVLKSADKLHIFGHSLGKTDHMYIKDFFIENSDSLIQNNKEIDLYYYGDDSYNQLLMQIDSLTLNNLSVFKQKNNFKVIDTQISVPKPTGGLLIK